MSKLGQVQVKEQGKKKDADQPFANDQVPAESLSVVPVVGSTDSIATDTIAEDSDMVMAMEAQEADTSTKTSKKNPQWSGTTGGHERFAMTRLKMRQGKTSDGFAVGQVPPASSIGAVAVPGTATITATTITSTPQTSVGATTTSVITSSSTTPEEDHSDIVPTILVAQLVPDDDNEQERWLQFLEEERNLQITVNAVPVEANKTGIDPATTTIMGLPKRTFWCLISLLLLVSSAAVITMALVLPRGQDTRSPETRAINQVWSIVGNEIDKDGGSWDRSPESTQYKALDWLANEDQWWESLEGDVPTQVLVERYALVAVLMSTDGESWPYDLDPTTSVCSWATGIVCDVDDEFVIALNFTGTDQSKIIGNLPTEVALLTSLVSLVLSRNLFFGPLPTELGRLTGLKTLDVLRGRFTGRIPTEFGSLTSLKLMNMTNNYLTGTIPTEMGLLTNIEYIVLGENMLTGSIPTELGNLAKLYNMSFQKNRFSGPLPTELSLLTSLEALEMKTNMLNGTIPTEMGLLTNLDYFDLADNLMTGSIPAELVDCTQLHALSVENNQITGLLPTELGLLTSLTRLTVLNNSLSGTIPTEIGLLTNITYFDVGDNEMSGTFPTELSKCTALVRVGLQQNQFSGNLSAILCGGGNVFNIFFSDCHTPNVTCSCCTDCCYANQTCTEV